MRAIGRGSEAFCKLSGLATEARPGWRASDLQAHVDVLLDAFGPARLMWGSDWPVVNEAGGYAAWRAAAETLTADLGADDRALIFGGTAAAFYGIGA
jgi:L-fuconolactonase